MKAYEATLTIDGEWKGATTGANIAITLDDIVNMCMEHLVDINNNVAKEIQITVKEI